MKDAFIITDSTVQLSDFKLYAKNVFGFWNVSEVELEYQILGDANSLIVIKLDNSIYDLMEPDTQGKICSEFDTFRIFMCLYFDFENLHVLIKNIPADKKIVINNDHGRVMKRDEFLSINSYDEFIFRE